MSRAHQPRRGSRLRSAVLLLAAAIVLPIGVAATATPAAAAVPAFDPAEIITDAEFYNHTAMTRNEIASFIADRNAACVPGSSGAPCLRNYRENTWTRGGDAQCPGTYEGAAGEDAATIISKVATACRINPQVLLVTLQKEQSLVTISGSSLTPRRYQIAMGYGCPDTAPCDAQYYGFYNQVYRAASQFQRYRILPRNYTFQAGRTVNIGYHPSASCGSRPVTIRNQATAGLYNYTPYTPNDALLSGSANSCSSYGNHNFHRFYHSWFGDDRFPVDEPIRSVWQAQRGLLGGPTTPLRTGLRDGGSVQGFAGGSVYSSPAAGTHSVRGGVGAYFAATGWEQGPLGYPRQTEVPQPRGGSAQRYEGGTVYWSPVGGPQIVLGSVQARWDRSGGPVGSLGYPVSNERTTAAGGTVQYFENGVISWHPSAGAIPVLGGVRTRWAQLGEIGGLGHATTEERALRDAGVVQSFERGAVYWTPRTGPHAVSGAFLAWYAGLRWENGPLGYPVNGEIVGNGSTTQRFERGTLTFDHRTGAVRVTLS